MYLALAVALPVVQSLQPRQESAILETQLAKLVSDSLIKGIKDLARWHRARKRLDSRKSHSIRAKLSLLNDGSLS
jgi:hypothetical protein